MFAASITAKMGRFFFSFGITNASFYNSDAFVQEKQNKRVLLKKTKKKRVVKRGPITSYVLKFQLEYVNIKRPDSAATTKKTVTWFTSHPYLDHFTVSSAGWCLLKQHHRKKANCPCNGALFEATFKAVAICKLLGFFC